MAKCKLGILRYIRILVQNCEILNLTNWNCKKRQISQNCEKKSIFCNSEFIFHNYDFPPQNCKTVPDNSEFILYILNIVSCVLLCEIKTQNELVILRKKV